MPRLNPALEGVSLPERIAALPVADNGFPVPWFVAWPDGPAGKPEFRAMDPAKLVRAIRERRCWVCGEPLGRLMTFVAGPMCGLNKNSSEPPSHTDCARFSAQYCPFLSRPHMVRREGGLEDATSAGFMVTRNPGVTLLWTTRKYRPWNDGTGGILFEIGPPEAVEWWREGRPATRAEVEESVRTGLPAILAGARTPEEAAAAEAELGRRLPAYESLYPRT